MTSWAASPGDGGDDGADQAAEAGEAQEEGGEAACLLHRVCPDCGRIAEERDARRCGRCGIPLPSP